jgi:hypothetical protein
MISYEVWVSLPKKSMLLGGGGHESANAVRRKAINAWSCMMRMIVWKELGSSEVGVSKRGRKAGELGV